MRIIVVGAGITGLSAAHALIDLGHDVIIVDKSRGSGGRMSTRRQGPLRFDHGAQYFTVRDERFLRQVNAWRELGVVQTWDARIAVMTAGNIEALKPSTELFIGVPGMNGICRELAREVPDLRLGWKAISARHSDSEWQVHSEDGEFIAGDVLLLAIPPRQAQDLLDEAGVNTLLQGFEMMPTWCLMVGLDQPLLADWDAAFVNGGELSWISNQGSRPGRPLHHAWVMHANPEWSLDHIEDDPADITAHLLDIARDLPAANDFHVQQAHAHRWRYAQATQPLTEGALWHHKIRLGLAGDWCNGSRVEGAYLSGISAAEKIHATHIIQ